MRAGLTGATGHLGSMLLARLLADPEVTSVASVARRPVAASHPKLRHVRADLRSGDARRALAGADVLWHLGFALWSGPDMASANLDGTANVLAARPGSVVLASSAAVYGAWPDNPLPLTEDHPARPNPECPYAAHKLEAERRCLAAAPTLVARVAAVLGSHADPAVARAAAGYRLVVPAVRGVAQATQFVDEDDAAAALHAAGAAATASQVVNVATTDWLDAAGVSEVAGGRVVALPRSVLLGGSRAAQRLGLLPFGADRSVLVCGPLALDATRAASVLGWRAARTSRQVLAAATAPGGGRGATPSSARRPWPRAGR